MSLNGHPYEKFRIDPRVPFLTVLIIGGMMSWVLNQVIHVPVDIPRGTIGYQPLNNSSSGFYPLYDEYTITQGVHGFSYGQMAIDISAGKGTKIKSPINGIVSEKYLDALGNPTLIIENNLYRITLLHGDYIVAVGEKVNSGQTIGTENNHGNTTDLQGRSCANRDCGYHTHVNLFDKSKNINVDPMMLLSP